MSNKIKAPFTKEQVEALNKFQRAGIFHPFTCWGKPYVPRKHQPGIERTRELCPKSGLLQATEDGWVYPCGNYLQDWAHAFMAEKEE